MFKVFFYFSSGGHFVQWSKTILKNSNSGRALFKEHLDEIILRLGYLPTSICR